MKQIVWNEDSFPWLQIITDKWESIRDYAISKIDDYVLYRETNIYTGHWMMYGFRNKFANWERADEFIDPILNELPFQPLVCSFSCLEPGVVIHPHKGWTENVIRFHLGLVCPPNVGIKIDDIVYTWQEGKWLIFNDTVRHSVANRGDQSRYVMLMDFDRKDIGLDAQGN